MRESYIESKLADKVKKMGGRCLKFTSPGVRGVPDRLILLPGGKIAFAELKAPGKKLGVLQKRWKQKLENLGFTVYVIDSVELVEEWPYVAT